MNEGNIVIAEFKLKMAIIRTENELIQNLRYKPLAMVKKF